MNINPFLFNKTNKNRNIDGSFTREIDGKISYLTKRL
jgi:hypothetical protein